MFPPILCRLLAKHRPGGPMSAEEISKRSELPIGLIESLSQCESWEGIDMPTYRKFTQGCGVDMLCQRDMKYVRDYLNKGPKFDYLKKSGSWDEYYKPMIKKWRDSYATRRRNESERRAAA